MSAASMVRAVLKRAERHAAPEHARSDERFRLELVEPLGIRADRWLEGCDGMPKAVGMRCHTIPIEERYIARLAMRGDGAVVDFVVSTVDYLMTIVCPKPRPKAWRLFSRRPR